MSKQINFIENMYCIDIDDLSKDEKYDKMRIAVKKIAENKFTTREKYIFATYFTGKLTECELGEILKISQVAVHKEIFKMKNIIRKDIVYFF